MKESRAIQVPCITCDAKPGKHCTQPGRTEPLIGGFHPLRIALAEKMVPHIPEELDATDKSLIAAFAFILLADSVSQNSEKLFSKKFTSAEIQVTFARQAAKQLIEMGLLGKDELQPGVREE